MLNRAEFNAYTYRRGHDMNYMVTYRGKNVVGGGTSGARRVHRGWQSEYLKYASATINNILSGNERPSVYARIDTIDKEVAGEQNGVGKPV